MVNDYNAQENYQSMYHNFDVNPTLADSIDANVANLPVAAYNIDGTVDLMRVIKSDIEISALRSAVDVTVQAFSEALPLIEPEMYEYEVDAMLEYIMLLNGCVRTAFPTIVASGENLNALHYQANESQMHDGDLVMIDFGVEYAYYVSDITRTVPVNGEFTAEQARIYNIVLEAHTAVLDAVEPGINYDILRAMQRDLIIDRLLEYGIIISGNRADIVSSGQYRQYIPAGLAHPVGLDPHDPWPRDAAGDKIFRENMVMAFEPHIYLDANDPTVNPDYWNISARIEDDVLITATGVEILSSGLPSTVDELEHLMR
jgi:Xaa-Pro aminopeptidase